MKLSDSFETFTQPNETFKRNRSIVSNFGLLGKKNRMNAELLAYHAAFYFALHEVSENHTFCVGKSQFTDKYFYRIGENH